MSFKTWRERSKCSNIILSKLIECDIHPKIIIGRGGENIRAIQYDTNTHIKILRDENTILITGYDDNDIEKAITQIMSCKTNNFDRRDKYNNQRGNNNFDRRDDNNFDRRDECNGEREGEQSLALTNENFPLLGS